VNGHRVYANTALMLKLPKALMEMGTPASHIILGFQPEHYQPAQRFCGELKFRGCHTALDKF